MDEFFVFFVSQNLACVVRGQFDPGFSFKDEHKSEQDFKSNLTCTNTEMQFQWAMQNI